jgi:hypothetical protein
MSESSGSPVWDTERTDAPRCRICQHWERVSENSTWGLCARIDPESAPAQVQCFGGTLETQEDFGCVLWKLKEGV